MLPILRSSFRHGRGVELIVMSIIFVEIVDTVTRHLQDGTNIILFVTITEKGAFSSKVVVQAVHGANEEVSVIASCLVSNKLCLSATKDGALLSKTESSKNV